jgi:hypothetical protein
LTGALAAGDLADAVADGDPTSLSDRHVLIGAGGLPGNSQDSVTVFKQWLGGWVHELEGERVKRPGGAGAAQDREVDPLADHRDVTGLEDRPGGLFETSEVLGHLSGIVTAPDR